MLVTFTNLISETSSTHVRTYVRVHTFVCFHPWWINYTTYKLPCSVNGTTMPTLDHERDKLRMYMYNVIHVHTTVRGIPT